MECRKQLCEKCKKKEDDYFLVTLACLLVGIRNCPDFHSLEKQKRFIINMLRQRVRCLYFNLFLFYRRVVFGETKGGF